MLPKKVKKHLVHDFCATKTGHAHTHTHTHYSKRVHTNRAIFLSNILEKIMFKMLNIFPKLENIWDNIQIQYFWLQF